MIPPAVLMRSRLKLLNTARPVNTAHLKGTVNGARPVSNVFNKAHSSVKRLINQRTAIKNTNFDKRVNNVRFNNDTTARPKAVVSTVKRNLVNTVFENKVYAVKASACWFWRPKQNVIDHGNLEQELQEQGVIDSGCSRHMTGNMSYLSDYEEIDGGYVAFGGDPRGGKITGKRFNQDCVLFTDTECIVLSPDFKLTDESHVLIKVPRKNNMYSVDLTNIVPSGGLTCLFAKATLDESKLWHKRLGHINFKTMNKLVRGNLVRGTDNQEKDEKQSQNDKTGLGMEKTVKDKAKSKPESQSSQKVNRKVNWSKSKSTPRPKSKKYKFRD
ncbi:ribonuclease H-like domain-containing protein [Tanacetum coccineum]